MASATTGVSPFFVNKGYHLRLTMDPIAPSSSSEAQCYMTDLDQLHSQLKASIAEAQEHYQRAADTTTNLQGRRLRIGKSKVLPNHLTLQEPGTKEPGTFPDNRHPR